MPGGKKAKGYEPYQNTKVPWMKTQGEIGLLLEKNGIRDIRWTSSRDRQAIMLEFIKLETAAGGEKYTVGVRIVIPGVTEENVNQKHRVLLYYLKAKFEALQFGVVEFTQEFFAHVMVPDGKGGTTTVYGALGPQYRQAALQGEARPLSLFPQHALTDGSESRA